jgi:hypothetical protein
MVHPATWSTRSKQLGVERTITSEPIVYHFHFHIHLLTYDSAPFLCFSRLPNCRDADIVSNPMFSEEMLLQEFSPLESLSRVDAPGMRAIAGCFLRVSYQRPFRGKTLGTMIQTVIATIVDLFVVQSQRLEVLKRSLAIAMGIEAEEACVALSST